MSDHCYWQQKMEWNTNRFLLMKFKKCGSTIFFQKAIQSHFANCTVINHFKLLKYGNTTKTELHVSHKNMCW